MELIIRIIKNKKNLNFNHYLKRNKKFDLIKYINVFFYYPQ